MRARAPLPIDPARLGSGYSWFRIASIAAALPVIFLAFFSHVDKQLVDRTDWGRFLRAVPLAWGLHVAGKLYDRRMKRLR